MVTRLSIELLLSFKPLKIDISSERFELYDRIKKMLERAEYIANNHENVRTRLRAMEITVKIASFLAGVLEDAQLDEIEAELQQLEETA